MTQPQTVNEPRADSARDPWSSWAKVVDLPAPDETAEIEEPAAVVTEEPAEAAVVPPAEVAVEEPAEESPAADVDLAGVLAQLAIELADERRQRAVADEARQAAQSRPPSPALGAAPHTP